MPTPLEAIKKALFNEMKSREFYRLAAENTERDDSRVLFMELADLEDEHARELARRISAPPLGLDFDAIAYLDELERSVTATLSPEDEGTVRKGGPRAVLRMAQRMEAESRDDYRELSRQAGDASVRRHWERLSRLEQGHLDQLVKLERSLDMPEEVRPPL